MPTAEEGLLLLLVVVVQRQPQQAAELPELQDFVAPVNKAAVLADFAAERTVLPLAGHRRS